MKVYIVEYFNREKKKWIPVGSPHLILKEAKMDILEWRGYDFDKYRIARYERIEK